MDSWGGGEELNALLGELMEDANVDDVVGVYLGGSHLFGCARLDSDWDLRIVMRDREQLSSSDAAADAGSVVADRELRIWEMVCGGRLYNITMYYEKEFIQRLAEHEINAVMCLLSPPAMRWRDNVACKWEMDPKALRESLFRKANSLFNRAKVYFQAENNPVAGRKLAGLSLRFLTYGVQLLGNGGSSIDFEAPNALVRRVQASSHTKWTDFRSEFRPLKHELMDRYPPLSQTVRDSSEVVQLETRHPGAFQGATEKKKLRALVEGRRNDAILDPAIVKMWDDMGAWLSTLSSHQDRIAQRIIWGSVREPPLEWIRNHLSLKDAKHVFALYVEESKSI